MDDIRFNSLDNFTRYLINNNIRVLGSGKEGTCYKIGDKSYKLYNELYCNLYNNDVYVKRLLQYKNVIIDNIYFIRALIYYNDNVVGSVTEYASGINCGDKKLHRCKIDKLVNALSILKNNIYELSKLGIYVEDDFLPNVIYDGNNFKLIDTGDYFNYSELDSTLNKDNVMDIYRKNMTKIIKMLFTNITNKYYIVDHFIFGFLWHIDSPYKSYLVDTDMLCNPDETILGIKNTICEYIGYEIDTFSKCKSDLLKIRKRK